jgi:hypothetical protein
VVTKDWFKRTVSRKQPGVAIALLEGLYRGLFLNQRSHYVSVVSGLLLTDYNPVTIANGGINHRIANYFEQEELALSHQLAR